MLDMNNNEVNDRKKLKKEWKEQRKQKRKEEWAKLSGFKKFLFVLKEIMWGLFYSLWL